MEQPEALSGTPKFQTWHKHLDENRIQVNNIEPLYIHQTEKDNSVLFALLKVDATTPDNTKLPSICFLKGDSVSILLVLIDEETNDKYVVLVKQRRICNGSNLYEHPAGMIDKDDSSPQEVAAREIKEETQLNVEIDELKPLFRRPLFSATATSDEALHFFYLERRMALADIKALHGRKTGSGGENEHTQLYIADIVEAHHLVGNIHGILGHMLYLQKIGDFETMSTL